MLRFRHAAVAALFLAATVPSMARAGVGFNFALAGAGVLPKSMDMDVGGTTTSASGKLGFGGGALLGTRFSPFWGMETGAVFLQRKYSATVDLLGVSISTDASANSLYIPLGIRIYLGRIFSLQAGGYYDLGLESGGGSNYGVQGGLRLSIPMGQSASLFADARYNQGLKDEGGQKASDLVMVLVGLSFGGMAK